VDFQEVSYVKLSGVQKQKALEILGRGNILLKKWAAFFPPKKYRQFRNAVMDGSKNPEHEGKKAIPSNMLKEFHADLPFMTTIRHDKYDDLDGRSVEQAILEGFSALAKRHAKKWSLEGDPVGLTKQDFLQEAYMQVIEAMYSWLPGTADISTFIWVALKNRMSNVVNQQGNMLCPLTNADLELMARFEQTKRGMPQYVTFDQIIGHLGLSSDEGKHLNTLLTRVFAENQLGGQRGDMLSGDESVTGNDYTGHRVGVDRESETETILQEQHVHDTLSRAGLTTLERQVIEAAMEPFHGWQTDFANNHINPATGKPYSRMRITQVLEMAREKVAKTLELQEAA
jgi:DNA-directed RNA polymerase specialized sigma24 family protein